MIFSTFFHSQKCPSLGNKIYGHLNCSQQDKAPFLVMWPSLCAFQASSSTFSPHPFPKPQSPSHKLLLTGLGAEFTATALPILPSGFSALCCHNPGEF